MTISLNKIAILTGGLLLCVNHMVFADGQCGVPLDQDGDTIANPTGSIPYIRMPNALCADQGEYTWGYEGTLKSGKKPFSFEAVYVQYPSKEGAARLGMHMSDFTFKDKDALFYSNSSYGGESQIGQAVGQSIDAIQSSASLSQLSVVEQPMLNPSAQWSIHYIGKQPILPLYKGLVGQPGAEYQLNGTGKTFLWRYSRKTGASSVQPYTYHFVVTVKDEMGAQMEGLGGGYVGPQLVPNLPTVGDYHVESEISQPRLRVLSWSMTFQAVGNAAAGYQSSYQFSGNNGMLWDDFGPVVKSHSAKNQEKSAMVSTLIQQNMSQGILGETTPSKMKGLYNGNWLPIDFTKGKYKGASIVFFAFWNPNVQYVPGLSTDDLSSSTSGWANFFSGVVNGQPDTAFSMMSTLYPENPVSAEMGTTERPPYKVTFDRYTNGKYGMATQWVQGITITVRANTPFRYALAAYADQLAGNNHADDPNKKLVIHIDAISPIAQNTMFSSTITQYFESAAVPSIDGKRVGYAWIEHSRNS